jgi:hypothetical protein
LTLNPNEAAERLVAVVARSPFPWQEPGVLQTRVSADEVAQIRRRCGAPEPWKNSCVDIGTITFRVNPHPVVVRVQDAIDKLKQAISEFDDVSRARHAVGREFRQGKRELGSFALIEVPINATGKVKKLSAQLEKMGCIIKKPYLSITVWHFSASILLNEYFYIAGAARVTRNSPAIVFVGQMLQRLGLGNRTFDAIERALRRDFQRMMRDPEGWAAPRMWARE